MSSGRPLTLTKTPLFTLGHACPQDVQLKSLFINWPHDNLKLLSTAQEMRDKIKSNITSDKYPFSAKLEMVNNYLPVALAMEKIKKENAKVTANKENRFKWKQSPIVINKYLERNFNSDYIANEVLHVIWLKAILLLNHSYLLYTGNDIEKAIATLKECAGIFHYLSADRLRVSNEPVAIEFQAPVFNSFTSLALGQAYSLIAAKGEADGISPSALGKLCYTVSATYSSALDAIKTAKPPEAIHEQFIHWLTGVKLFYQAAAAANLAYAQNAAQAIGKSIGLIRLAIGYLEQAVKLDKHNIRLNEASNELIAALQPIDKKWTQENFTVQAEYVPPAAEAEMIMTTTCTMMPNLPQPTPFSLPEPAQ
ncbi:hypothetical protein TRFO_04373 [Tritrichomonas foetus]|uniref:BRO1 domain-containing protein n=1 Tax=Tritrichomonas foetus TaxID=1144522 RepID=A0A1J4KJ48_9EUKA|nr:hypothetical protein TRFO_04373 [Tritrichomonas foetus]|eukprot:OHT09852.1 hypothetical protein TRFO_04373 [Tritrichomonas foetus]